MKISFFVLVAKDEMKGTKGRIRGAEEPRIQVKGQKIRAKDKGEKRLNVQRSMKGQGTDRIYRNTL